MRVRKGPKSGVLKQLQTRRNPFNTKRNSKDGYPLSGEGCGDTLPGSILVISTSWESLITWVVPEELLDPSKQHLAVRTPFRILRCVVIVVGFTD